MPAAERGDAATVASALRNPLTDPNMTDQIGMTALMRATVHGRASVAVSYTHLTLPTILRV